MKARGESQVTMLGTERGKGRQNRTIQQVLYGDWGKRGKRVTIKIRGRGGPLRIERPMTLGLGGKEHKQNKGTGEWIQRAPQKYNNSGS